MALKDKYFTISEAAQIAGVTRQTVSRWVAEDYLTAEKVGRQTLIDKKQFGQYLRQQSAYRMATDIVDGMTERIREKYKYSKEDKVGFLKIIFKKDMFIFSVTREDGTKEKVSVSVSPPEKLDSKGDSFLLLGYKLPIKKIERRQSNK